MTLAIKKDSIRGNFKGICQNCGQSSDLELVVYWGVVVCRACGQFHYLNREKWLIRWGKPLPAEKRMLGEVDGVINLFERA